MRSSASSLQMRSSASAMLSRPHSAPWTRLQRPVSSSPWLKSSPRSSRASSARPGEAMCVRNAKRIARSLTWLTCSRTSCSRTTSWMPCSTSCKRAPSSATWSWTKPTLSSSSLRSAATSSQVSPSRPRMLLSSRISSSSSSTSTSSRSSSTSPSSSSSTSCLPQGGARKRAPSPRRTSARPMLLPSPCPCTASLPGAWPFKSLSSSKPCSTCMTLGSISASLASSSKVASWSVCRKFVSKRPSSIRTRATRSLSAAMVVVAAADSVGGAGGSGAPHKAPLSWEWRTRPCTVSARLST
mmetsp:Transcript_34022/g.72347  ORF Transcript_34022/g.72347 Transcript_34022/m.72347 type:complete len:298 (+) Transcript_34022:386-1279(+)